MQLYYFASCRFCQRVFATIDQLGIRNQFEFRDIHEHPEYAKELEKLTGRQTVPCLVINGEPMFESFDIISFLNKKFKK